MSAVFSVPDRYVRSPKIFSLSEVSWNCQCRKALNPLLLLVHLLHEIDPFIYQYLIIHIKGLEHLRIIGLPITGIIIRVFNIKTDVKSQTYRHV